MNTATLDRPPDRVTAPSAECIPVDRIGKYSVADPSFIRATAAALMQRCVRQDCELPVEITSALGLVNGNCHALGMADALLAIADLEERRALICRMVHAIIRLQ